MNTAVPIIFFSLGKCRKFHPTLKSALANFGLDNVGHIEMPEDFSGAMLKSEVERVRRAFLHSGVQADVLRANFFIYDDETALAFPDLLHMAEKLFTAIYPAGVITDVYCLIDDVNLLENAGSRNAVFQMLGEFQRDEGFQIYLLSNLSDKNAFLSEENAAQTAALLTLFKNYTSSHRAGAADASRYNEFFFLENCKTRSGNFLTAGSVVLSVPHEAIGALIATEILLYGSEGGGTGAVCDVLPAPIFPPKRTVKSMEYLCGIAIPSANFADPLTRGQWISRLFGERLERIVGESEVPPDAEDDEQSEEDMFPGMNFYELLHHTGEDGDFYIAAKEDAEAALAELKTVCERHERWLNARPDLKNESPTRRLSPIKTQNLFPYALASEFLKRKVELQFLDEKIKVLERRVRSIYKFHKRLARCGDEIKKTIAAYNEKFALIEIVFHQGASDYFQKKFAEYAAENKSEIDKLCLEMTEALRRSEFNKFKTRLNEFVEKNILSAPMFALPVADILREMGEIPATAVAEWTMHCNHMGVRLRTGSTQLYTETNLYVPEAATGLEVKKICEARGIGRLNLFADENAACVAALYHSGAFDASELYYLASEDEGEDEGVDEE
ncbi:MAG: hypothetical protein FWF80_07560 [Defluviitaleaceae bacterium]|nr:hypothetical protein [Defluviitaleaceae bacterium]